MLMIDNFLAVIAPHNCLSCGVEGSVLCTICQAAVLLVAERCYKCHQLSVGGRTCQHCRHESPLFSVQAATRYEGIAKQLIWQLKFERAKAAAADAAWVMSARLVIPAGAVVVPVP